MGAEEDLRRELEERSTAEVVNGKVVQITQALSESDDSVEVLMFGELRKQAIIPIDQACAECDFLKKTRFKTVQECQAFQAIDARKRGFHNMICAKQFVD